MTGTEIVTQIIQILVSALKPFGEAIGDALSAMAQAIFLQTVGTGSDAVTSLSVFGTLIIVFAAISLAVGLSRWVLNFVSSLGNRNR